MRLLSKNALSLSLFALLAFAVSSSAQTPPAVPRKTPAKAPPQAPVRGAAKPAALVAPQLKFEKNKLENGLEVIFSEDHRLPMGAGHLWFPVGPSNALPGRTGCA